MPYADTTRSRLLIRPKANYRDQFTLGSTHFQDLRTTGESLKAAKETVDNEEIRGDGTMGRQERVGRSVAGDVNGHLSFGTYDMLMAAALRNTASGWTSDALGVGVTPQIFDLERGLLDVSKFFPFVDQYVNTMSVEIQAKRNIGISFGFIGAEALASSGNSIDPAPITKTTSRVMKAGAGISALNLGIDGAAAAAHPGKVTSWRLQTNAGYRARPNVQSDISDEMGINEFGVTVTVAGYLKDAVLHDACLGHLDVSMDLLASDSLGNSYHFYIDRATISDHSGNAGAKNQDVVNNYTIQAYGANALRIVRAAAV